MAQLQLALAENVWYVGGDWQPLADGLRDAAQNECVRIISEAKIVGIDRNNAVH